MTYFSILHLAPERWKSSQDYCLLKWLIGIRDRVALLLLMCVRQCFRTGNHLYNPNGLLNFFLLKGRLTNGYNIRTAKWTQFWWIYFVMKTSTNMYMFYNVPQERNQNIFLCYMMLVCILIQKGNIVSIEITYKHNKTHK